MNGLPAFCVRHRFLVIFVVLLIGSIAVRAARSLPIDAVPDVTNVQVQVLTNAPGFAPLEVEQYITAPVEMAMGGLPRLEEVRSLSRFGVSVVTVVFEEGTDIHRARQLVSERLAEARETIPPGYGTPVMGPIATGLGEVFQFEVRGDPMCEPGQSSDDGCLTLMQLRSVLDWYIALQLRPLEGVVEVNPFGGEVLTWEVRVDPAALRGYGLSITDVYEAIEANHANEGGGYLLGGGEQQILRGEALVQTIDELRAIRVLTDEHGVPVLLGDLADVAEAPLIRQGAATRDGRGEVVTGTVMMLMGANAGDVTRAVRERLAELAPGLPPGVTIETLYDRSELVDRTIRTVATNLIEGGVLVIVVLLLMLGNVRGGLIVASVIPLAFGVTLLVMYGAGVSGNLMSLGALDFGLIIDGAIVVLENIMRRLSERGVRAEDAAREVARATREVIRPVLFGTAIIMIVYVPILALEGIEGKMFRPMAIAVIAALAAALVLALTWVPALAAWLYRGGVTEREPLLARGASAIYRPLLTLALRFRVLVVAATLVLLTAGGVAASRMGAEFIPTLDEGAIAIQAIRLPSVSLEASVDATTRIESCLLEGFPDEVASVVSRTGRPEIATDPMGVEMSDIYLTLHPVERWTRASSKAELVEAIEAALRLEVPGQAFAFSQPIELRTNELISGVRSDVAVNLYGDDFAVLQDAAERVVRVLDRVDGAVDLSADRVEGLPLVRIRIDRERASRMGIDARDLLDTVAAVGGRTVGVAFAGAQRIALRVRFPATSREDIDALRRLPVRSASGATLRLDEVATVTVDDGPVVVNRESAQRRVTVQANVRGRDLAGFVDEAQRRIRDEAGLPPGIFVSWGGQFENLQSASERLAIAVPAALALIFLLLYSAFGATRPAVIIFLNVPVAATGGVFALLARDLPLSISAAVGFIALSGIAVMNGVVLVSTIRDLQREGLSLFDATERGARLRLRAVLMTALTDGIGFLPMALSVGAGAEVQRPLATVVIGGLVTSTLLTLFVIPAIYSRLGGAPAPREPDDPDSGLPAE